MAFDSLRNMSRKDKSNSITRPVIVAAILFGITLGAIQASTHPLRFPTSDSPSFVVDGTAGSRVRLSRGPNDDKVDMLGEEVGSLTKENQQLKLKEIELKELVRELQAQAQTPAQTRQVDGNDHHPLKAGPVGSIKSLRTNAALEPDESVNPELAKLLKSVATNGELVVGISNKKVLKLLKVWFESLKRSGVTNFLVVALDDETDGFCKESGVNSYRRDARIPDAQKGTGANHAVSGLKFHLLRDFLALGYSVLLSDVDVIYLQNPFNFLVRDCDVEGMTDGFNNGTAYGLDDVYNDPSMGWSRSAHTMRIWVFNSGLFYIRPTVASIELLDRVTSRLSTEKAWDQAVFNEELFYPSHPGYDGLHASKRVMDFYMFLNSKVLFKTIRKEDRWKDHKPVTIHVNYHPDKYARMLAIVDYYVSGNVTALDKFPDGVLV